MNDIEKWLEGTRSRCALFSEAYRLQLGRLWWANLLFVVVPAVCSTAAAIFAAIPDEKLRLTFGAWLLPPASILAGLAAILVAVHKALKCDEYQAECLRLAQRYQAIAEAAAFALSLPGEERVSLEKSIAEEMKALTDSVKARLPSCVLSKANMRFENSKLFWIPMPNKPLQPITRDNACSN